MTDFKLGHYPVEVEVDMGGLRPDAVLRRAGRVLLVEFAVTHFCDAAKAAELRRRGLPCVEVDLSGVPRAAPREEHARHVLRDAPRHWTHNARIEAAEARLRAVAQGRAEAERAPRACRYARIAEAVVAAWSVPPRAGDPAWTRWTHDAGLDQAAGVSLASQEVFAVDALIWQAVLLHVCLLTFGGRSFGVDQVLRGLRERRMLKAPFSDPRVWDADLVGHVRRWLEDFRPPAEVVADYCAHLVGHGLLKAVSGGWRAHPDRVRDVRSRLASARAARAREGEVLRRVMTALAAVGADLPPGWMDAPSPGLGASPAEIARAGGDMYDILLRRLGALARMVHPGGDPVRTGLLGLPLAGANRVRAQEARIRDQDRRRRLEAAGYGGPSPPPFGDTLDTAAKAAVSGGRAGWSRRMN